MPESDGENPAAPPGHADDEATFGDGGNHQQGGATTEVQGPHVHVRDVRVRPTWARKNGAATVDRSTTTTQPGTSGPESRTVGRR